VAIAAGVLGYILIKPKTKIGDCCPGQSAGFLPQDINYNCRGKMENINGFQAYVVGKGSKAVVMGHDIFGLHTGRLKQIADEIASRGFLVVVPDFFEVKNGGLCGRKELGFGTVRAILEIVWALVSGGMKSYMREHPWDPYCKRVWTAGLAPWLKEQSCSSVGFMSFCWGAYVAMHIAALNSDPALPVAANVMYHPSFATVAAIFNENQEATVKAAAKVPTKVYSTSMEPKSWQPDGRVRKWMCGANNSAVIEWHQQKQMHGFMTRGDMKGNLQLAEDVQRCLDGGIAFLQRHLC